MSSLADISPPAPRTDEHDRLVAVRQLRLVDTLAEERFDRIVRIAESLFQVPMVAINLIDEDCQFTKSAFPADRAGTFTPREVSFCTVTVKGNDTLHVPDATADPRFAENPLVTGGPNIRFYAGHPLTANGQRVGALCLVGDTPRTLTGPEQLMLRDLAGWVERELEWDAEMAYAAKVQARLLPPNSLQMSGYEVTGACVTARDVGGDFYGWHTEGDRLYVMLADVMGKGVGPALLAAGLRAALRATVSGANFLADFNRAAASVEDDFTDTAAFATAFVAEVTPSTGAVTYVDAGHSLGLIVDSNGTCRRLPSTCLPLGILPNYQWESTETYLLPGEALVISSDGILDLFPTIEAMVDYVGKVVATSSTAQAAVDEILSFAALSAAGGEDDLTIVAVRRRDQPTTAGPTRGALSDLEMMNGHV